MWTSKDLSMSFHCDISYSCILKTNSKLGTHMPNTIPSGIRISIHCLIMTYKIDISRSTNATSGQLPLACNIWHSALTSESDAECVSGPNVQETIIPQYIVGQKSLLDSLYLLLCRRCSELFCTLEAPCMWPIWSNQFALILDLHRCQSVLSHPFKLTFYSIHLPTARTDLEGLSRLSEVSWRIWIHLFRVLSWV